MKLDPATDPRLTEPERALYTRVYPLVAEIEAELDVAMSKLVAFNFLRRAVSEGAHPPELIAEASTHIRGQDEYNKRIEH
jgi:hypothetical protein